MIEFSIITCFLKISTSSDECEVLIRRVCLHCAPRSCTAWGLLQATTTNDIVNGFRQLEDTVSAPVDGSAHILRHLPTGLHGLDRHLRGGIRVGTLTELVGRAGTAKTQLAMQMCVLAASVHGLGSVYIDTEQKLNLPRLKQIASERSSSRLNSTSMNAESFLYGYSSHKNSILTMHLCKQYPRMYLLNISA